MRLFDEDPNLRWLFCMTHPDDEISICAWIKRLVNHGASVYMSWSHSTPTREREARAVAMMLGLPEENLFFFGAPDGNVAYSIPELYPQFQKMMDTVKPDRVCCGAFEQGHIDHDATNFLVSHTYSGPILEIPFYHTYATRIQCLNRFADPRGEEIFHLDIDDQRLKVHVSRQFPSQNIWSILKWYEFCNRAIRKPVYLARSERMRLLSHSDYGQPNLPPKLAARVEKTALWQNWLGAMKVVEDMGLQASGAESLIH